MTSSDSATDPAAHDAQLFAALHKAIEEDLAEAEARAAEAASDEERRAGDRREFHCVQLVAPYLGTVMPTPAMFRHVQCQDLSPQGFSFVVAAKPSYEFLIVALGRAPFTFVVAQAVRVIERGAADGGREHLVGCKFLRRVTPASA